MPLIVAVACATAPAEAQLDYRAVAAAHQGSLTGARLRADATANITAGLRGMDSCPSITVLSMHVIEFTNAKSPWRERWIIADCKRTRPVTFLFTPTSDGGADIAISLKK
jgi:hypothetical protein